MAPHPPHGVAYAEFDPADEGRRETLLALGNGKLMVRAAAPWSVADAVHYPGTYRAGCYDRLTDRVLGEGVANDSLVNLPNWLPLTFRQAGEDLWFALDGMAILRYRHELDTVRGLAERDVLVRDTAGRETWLRERRLVSMDQPDLAALRLEIAPVNWSGGIVVRSALDGAVANLRVPRFGRFNPQHLTAIADEAAAPGLLVLRARTGGSGIAIGVAARTVLAPATASCVRPQVAGIAEYFPCDVAPDAPAVVEKIAAILTSLDAGIGDPGTAAVAMLRDAPGFAALEEAHTRAWAPLLSAIGIASGRLDVARSMRVTAFSVLQTASPHSVPLDTGFPARGWQEAYHGQIFWDETFVLPYLALRHPEIARELLLYRYRRLDDARAAARAAGYRGAMFPWRSAADGREKTPLLQFNPLSGRWMPDHTRLQRHIGAAIAMNVWRTVLATGDDAFLATHGAELLAEIARFWASIARHDPASDRYDIEGVSGPDEYHVQWPGAARPGLRNNAYTNVMASWSLARACEALDLLPAPALAALRSRIGLDAAEPGDWERVSRRLRLPFRDDGTLMPFEGFDRLRPLDLAAIAAEQPGHRLDWVLEARGETTNTYQAMKQADTLVLPYLLSHGILAETLAGMGYRLDDDALRRTADFDLARTTHDSSLSSMACAGALARLDPDASWRFFEEALRPEHDPSAASKVAEGAHLGARAGAIDVLQRHYLGLGLRRDAILLSPAAPPPLGRVRVAFACRFGRFACEWTGTVMRLRADHANRSAVPVRHPGGKATLHPGRTLEIPPLAFANSAPRA